MESSKEIQLDKKLALVRGDACDKYDYLIAAFCGLSAGLIDAFFIGGPSSGTLGNFVDNTADEFVKNAAQCFWKFDKRSSKSQNVPESLQQCISYLEQAFPVSYDARYARDLNVPCRVLAEMTPQNHHLLALAHSPDIIGLIFSIIDQFANMASFISSGKIIRVFPTKTSKSISYLQGTTIPSKLFCGFVNWIGHLISDIAGSSSTRRASKIGRGMGIPIPFYELFLLCDFGDIDGESFADIAVNIFEKGYDLRHGVTMAIPVLLNDLMVRILWSVKRRFYHQKEWKDCIPTDKHSDLRLMVGGLMLNIKAKKSVEDAKDFADEADEAVVKMGDAEIELNKVRNLGNKIRIELERINCKFKVLMNYMETVVEEKTDYNIFTYEEKKQLEHTVLSLKLLKQLSMQNILDSNNSNAVLEKEVENTLNHVIQVRKDNLEQ